MLFLRGKKKKNYGVRATTDLTSKRSHKNMGKQIVLESTRNGICSVDNSLSEDTLRTVWDFILILALYLSI